MFNSNLYLRFDNLKARISYKYELFTHNLMIQQNRYQRLIY